MFRNYEVQQFHSAQTTSYSNCASNAAYVSAGRSLDGHADDVFAAEQHQSEHPLLLLVTRLLARLRLDPSELLAVAQNHIHVLVER